MNVKNWDIQTSLPSLIGYGDEIVPVPSVVMYSELVLREVGSAITTI